jgi:hypothetical protein
LQHFREPILICESIIIEQGNPPCLGRLNTEIRAQGLPFSTVANIRNGTDGFAEGNSFGSAIG